MQRRLFTAALISSMLAPLAPLAPLAARAAPRQVVYEGEHDGVVTRLLLQIDGGRVDGALAEGDLQLRFRGQLDGRALSGRLHEPALGLPLMRIRGTLAGDDLNLTAQAMLGDESRSLRLRRVGAPPASGAAVASEPVRGGEAAQGGVDPRFVGRWRHESHINSPGGAGGFASFSTVRLMELGGDARVRQWVGSSGGGSQWSHRGGDQLEFSGLWQMRGDQVWVKPDGHVSFVPGGRMRLVDGRLVTEVGGTRRIWQR